MDEDYLKKLTEQFVSELAIPELKGGEKSSIPSSRQSDSAQVIWKSDHQRFNSKKTDSNKYVTYQAKSGTNSGVVFDNTESGCSCKPYDISKKRQPDSMEKTDDAFEQGSATSSVTRTTKSAKVQELLNIVKMRAKEQKSVDAQKAQSPDFTKTPSEHSDCTNTTEELRKLVMLQCKQLGKNTKKQNARRLADIKEESETNLAQKATKSTERIHQCPQSTAKSNQSQDHRVKKLRVPKVAKVVTASGRSFNMSVDEIINCQTVQPVLAKIQAMCLDNVQQTVDVMKSLSKLPKDISKALKGLE